MLFNCTSAQRKDLSLLIFIFDFKIRCANIRVRGKHGDLYTKNLNPALVARRANAEDRPHRVIASLPGEYNAEDLA
jgi:hypothetical protein